MLETMVYYKMFHVCILAALLMTAVVCRRPTPDNRGTSWRACDISHYRDNESGADRQDCFQGLCWCTKTTANCSRHNGNLAFIPQLPREISFLDFSNNNISNISLSFFANVTHLKGVKLSHNEIAHIDPQAFANMTQLEMLILDGTIELTTTEITPIFQVTSLNCLDLFHASIKTLPEATVMPRLSNLSFHDNDIDVVDLTEYQHMADFMSLQFGSNSVHTLIQPASPMKRLTRLDLSRNRLNKFPETCTGNSTSLFPALDILNLGKNRLKKIPTNICLPELTELSLGGNFFPVLYRDMFPPSLFPRLTKLYLKFVDTKIVRIYANAFRHPTLKILSFGHNGIDFERAGRYSVDTFAGCPNLTELYLNGNVFTDVSDEHFAHLIGKIKTLKILGLGGTGFQRITTNTFAQLHQLEELYLYWNKIAQIPDGAFRNNVKLHTIRLNLNRISNINEKTFSQDLRRRFRVFDASGNPFLCDCDLRWFSQWLRTRRGKLGPQWTGYKCSNLNHSVYSFTMQDQACLLGYTETVNIITSISVITFLFVSFALLFACKWQIRLRLYEVFRGPADVRRHALMTGKFRYDVFVSYTSEDQRWVTQHLMPELEGRMKFKLCIHERDFIPGRHIVDNIVQCLESSKKVLVVFSKHFLASSWCQFELAVCLQHVLDCDDSLLVVCLGDVASRQMTSAMEAVMKTMTYIQWERGSERCARMRSAFWHRIGMALEEASITSSL